MEVTTDDVLGWTRVGVLLLGMGLAAWMDHKNRRVPNEHWIVWAKPAIFLWALDLMVQGADWTIYLTAFGVVAYAGVAVFGRATLRDARAGSGIDRVFLLWYVVSAVGFVFGAIKYQTTTPLDVILGDGDALGILWWKTASVFLVIFIIDLTWRMRLLHGGADAKALMWVALVFPSWVTVPTPLSSVMSETVVALPVAIALLMWGGLAFLFIPLIMLIVNVKKGALRSLKDLRFAWHATQIPLNEVMQRHVWMLTGTMVLPNGEHQVIHRTRAPRRTPSPEELQEQIHALEELDVERVWVSLKMPLLVFLFPAIVPLVLLGEPTALIMNLMS
ncbi:MAG: hypothetical protein CMA65_06440 [Euryarchaeota archaeon]|nr:hypothetical protein [Euryarchaeota archaeon]